MSKSTMKGIVKLTKEQFETLRTTGSVTVNDEVINYSPLDTLYIVPDTTEQDIQDLKNNKVDKVEGKGLSTNDYTTEEKNKLAALENYNDQEIRQEINNIQESIPTSLSELTQDESHRLVTDENINNWEAKLDGNLGSLNADKFLGTDSEGNIISKDFSIVDNLESEDSKAALSARQGKVISDKLQNMVTLDTEQTVVGKKIFENAMGKYELNSYTTSTVINSETSSTIRPLLIKGDYLYCIQDGYICKVSLTDNSSRNIKISENVNSAYTYIFRNLIIAPVTGEGIFDSIMLYDTDTDTYELVKSPLGYIPALDLCDNILYVSSGANTTYSSKWVEYNLDTRTFSDSYTLPLLQNTGILPIRFIRFEDKLYIVVVGRGTSGEVNQNTYFIGEINISDHTADNFIGITLKKTPHSYQTLIKDQKIYMFAGLNQGYYDTSLKTWTPFYPGHPSIGTVTLQQIINLEGNILTFLSNSTRNSKYILKMDIESLQIDSYLETLPYTNTNFALMTPDFTVYGQTTSSIYYFKNVSYSKFITLDELNKILENYTKKS